MERGMKKWMPFDSVYSSKDALKHLLLEKNKVSKPFLSNEQLEILEKQIWEALHTQSLIQIVYFFQGKYNKKENVFITKIYPEKKKIIFSDNSSLYFEQIIKISFIIN